MPGVTATPFPPSPLETLEKSTRPARVMFYAVADRLLCVTTPDEWSARLFERYFSGWHIPSCAPVPDFSPDAIISIRSDTPPSLPDGLISFEVAFGGRCHTDGKVYFFESCDSLIHVRDGAPSQVEIWIGESQPAQEENHLARLVFSAATAALRRCGLYELHGGATVDPFDQTGVLFIGPSGSGKSTLTMQLAAAGWSYLSDDTLLVYSDGAEVQARALRRAFAVTEPTIASSRISGLGSIAIGAVAFDPLKRRFDPQVLFPGGFAEACVPRTLFFPVVAGEDSTRARRLSQSETMALLLKMCPWSCYDQPIAREHLQVLAMLAKQSSSYELLAARDLLDEPGYAAKFIASVVGQNRVK